MMPAWEARERREKIVENSKGYQITNINCCPGLVVKERAMQQPVIMTM